MNKICLENHVSTPANDAVWDDSGEAGRNGVDYTTDVKKRLVDVQLRLADMDACGIRHAVLSLTSPGTQMLTDPAKAADFAKAANDYIAEHYVAANPKRFSAWATVALNNPKAAADELERAVKELGAKGALINGYTNGNDDILYLDHPSLAPFWERVETLGVPVYLHPREPAPGGAWRIYDGYSSLIGSAWGFAAETAGHALRLIMSGLFDRHPGVNIVLGHFGESLSFMLPRCEHRLYKQRHGSGLGHNKRPLTDYLRTNFYATSSGHFHTPSLESALLAFGEDRILFAADYPYEDMHEAATWFDHLVLPQPLLQKIAAGNAAKLMKIGE